MVRIRHILDPDLKQRVLEALAERRGMSVASIPEWFELDDADYVDLLNDLKEPEHPQSYEDDPRM
jgi:hypothetical protein